MMTSYRIPGGVFCLILMVFFVGCATQSAETNGRQADIGLGIVEGTKGYQQIEKEKLATHGAMRKVRGQVFRIEGAAYVVHTKSQNEIRLPVDEDTQIDRPAHKGDWIDAYVDEAGRAMFIRNVDDQVVLE
jgi:hypothetical protein